MNRAGPGPCRENTYTHEFAIMAAFLRWCDPAIFQFVTSSFAGMFAENQIIHEQQIIRMTNTHTAQLAIAENSNVEALVARQEIDAATIAEKDQRIMLLEGMLFELSMDRDSGGSGVGAKRRKPN
jgi:hypothetical protein